ncbi:hypothetical protein KI387_017528, partial [Taxus chinensis]
MGNCMQSRVRVCVETGDQVIKVMRMDGKMLEYNPPLLVGDLLIENGNHMVVHSQNLSDALPHDHKLEGGHLYYLIPMEADKNGGGTVTVEDLGPSGGADNGLRLKIVVSKEQLKALLSDGFLKEKLMEQLLLRQLQSRAQQEESDVSNRRWTPSLEKIPE